MKLEEYKGRCLVHFQKKVCFLKIDKCAGTTVFHNLFKGHNHGKTWRWDNYIQNPSILNDNYVFCILRDPVERLISGYFEILKRTDWPETFEKDFYKNSFKSNEHRFVEFVKDLEIDPDWNGHCARQKWFITDEQNEIIKVDDFWSIQDVTEKMKEKFDLQIVNKNTNTRPIEAQNLIHFINIYPNIKNKLKQIYREDYELIKEKIGDKL